MRRAAARVSGTVVALFTHPTLPERIAAARQA
jgi:hypothetical protein